jgi:hypothetical protein
LQVARVHDNRVILFLVYISNQDFPFRLISLTSPSSNLNYYGDRRGQGSKVDVEVLISLSPQSQFTKQRIPCGQRG